MAKVLGLSFFFHDSSAALVVDGRIVAAAAEERFSRVKHSSEFPKFAIEYCLREGGIGSINELDAIVFYEKPVMKFQRLAETLVATWPFSLGVFARSLPKYLQKKLNVLGAIRDQLPGFEGEILFSEHHLSHAASAFYASPFADAAVLTLDGVGEWDCTAIGVGRGNKLELLKSMRFPHSLGLLYAALTSYLGFKVNDGEWKVMGLTPYGKPVYAEQFRKLLSAQNDGSFALDLRYFRHHYSRRWSAHHGNWERLFGFPARKPGSSLEQHHQDLACSGQVVVEELVLALAREARRLTGSKNLVIAGGVGLNVVANTRIERAGIFENVWVQPAPGDGGAALGAALLVAHGVHGDKREPMRTAALGPDVRETDVATFLAGRSIAAKRLSEDELCRETAALIAEGKVVGWFQGRMEFGPRALGQRSILADARNPRMKEILNEKIKYRESFRPFAPVVPEERAADYFELVPGADYSFMTKVVPVRADKRAVIPSVTHADGSARLQTVSKSANPLLHRLLAALGEITGVPVAVNTSFNIRGEPIVCTIEDAYRCFEDTGMDALVAGPFLIRKAVNQLAPTAAEGFARSDALEGVSGAKAVFGRALLAAKTALAAHEDDTEKKVLGFYKLLPFNVHSNAPDTAVELLKKNPLKNYPTLDKHLRSLPASARVLDVGCGGGWVLHSLANYYQRSGTGIDLNPVVIERAKSVACFVPGSEKNEFRVENLFRFQPDQAFDVVNSLGVLHHTPDCRGAIRNVGRWVKPGGYLHLGLYHLYGRRPFLQHFERLRAEGRSEAELLEEFRRLNPEMQDETHLVSWFRDQVQHPHETQHTYEELHGLLVSEGFEIETTSVNGFRKLPTLAHAIELEKKFERDSIRAIKAGRYYPGFVVVWARKKVIGKIVLSEPKENPRREVI